MLEQVSSPLVEKIIARIDQEETRLQQQYANRSHGHTPVAFIDGLLDQLQGLDAETMAKKLPALERMTPRRSFRERKYTTNRMDELDSMIREICFALQTPELIKKIEAITGIKNLLPDPSLYASGISAMSKADFLSPHIDNSHDSTLKVYRRLNLLFYLSPNWSEEKGGHLQLWDPEVSSSQIYHSFFNRLIIMETNRTSYHSVSPVVVDGPRYCVSSYLFTEASPEEKDYYHVTSFSAPASQPVKRALFGVDTWLRNQVRKIKKEGLVKPQLYR